MWVGEAIPGQDHGTEQGPWGHCHCGQGQLAGDSVARPETVVLPPDRPLKLRVMQSEVWETQAGCPGQRPCQLHWTSAPTLTT